MPFRSAADLTAQLGDQLNSLRSSADCSMRYCDRVVSHSRSSRRTSHHCSRKLVSTTVTRRTTDLSPTCRSCHSICSAEDPIQEFTDVLIKIANNSIPKSKTNTKKHNTIWCNEDCKSAIKTRNKALKRVQKYPTQQNIENYRVIRAKNQVCD